MVNGIIIGFLPSRMPIAGPSAALRIPPAALRHCMDTVRLQDWEHYVGSLFVRGEVPRASLFAIRALAIETARLPGTEGSPGMAGNASAVGALRMQFWKDMVDNVYAVCHYIHLCCMHSSISA
jgi:hypothetical protein